MSLLKYRKLGIVIQTTICVIYCIFKCNTVFCQDSVSNPFTVSSSYFLDYINIASGGIKKGDGIIGNIDFKLNFETKKAHLWDGGLIHVYGLSNFGMIPTRNNVQCLQTFDNIETSDKVQIFEFYYQQSFKNSYLVIGQSNINAEFFNCEKGETFINSNFNTEPEIAANTSVSIFSKATLGIKYIHNVSENLSLMGCVYNGYTGSPEDNPYNNKYRFGKKEGLLYMLESDYVFKENSIATGNLKMGLWHHSGQFTSFLDSTQYGNVSGIFLNGEKKLSNLENQDKGFDAFFMSGFVPTKDVIIKLYFSLGFHYKGLWSEKHKDMLGLAFTNSTINSTIVNRNPNRFTLNETLLEMFYKIECTNNISLQPDLQCFLHPGARTDISHSLIGILRLIIVL